MSTTQEWVLAEYRRRRNMHRPYPAMCAIAEAAATSYIRGVKAGLEPDSHSQLRDLFRWTTADQYARVIYARAHTDDHKGAHPYWACGVLHDSRRRMERAS